MEPPPKEHSGPPPKEYSVSSGVVTNDHFFCCGTPLTPKKHATLPAPVLGIADVGVALPRTPQTTPPPSELDIVDVADEHEQALQEQLCQSEAARRALQEELDALKKRVEKSRTETADSGFSALTGLSAITEPRTPLSSACASGQLMAGGMSGDEHPQSKVFEDSKASLYSTVTEKDNDLDRGSCVDKDDQTCALGEVFSVVSLKPSMQDSHAFQLLVKYGSLFIGAVGVIMVLVAKSEEWGLDESSSSGSGSSSGSSRRLEGSSADHRRLGAGPPPLLAMVAYCLTAAGICAFTVNLLKQPLILGYLLAGVLVGPVILDIVPDVSQVQDFSSLGLTFLLFLVGLELDVKELLGMGPVVLLTGLCQFPLTVGIHLGIFMGFDALGIDFGPGKSVLYVAMCCGISSTMIVAKILSERSDMDSPPGRLTIGILIFQDIWAIIVLVIQPDLDDPQPMKLLEQFGKISILIVIALLYAKFVMHHVFTLVSDNVELMLVISLCWCFFIASFAILPFMGQSLELASLIAGVCLASFPYVAEFNGKIKFVRDFFITIFFTGLGMQIPAPRLEPILIAALVAGVVLSVRWIGIWGLVMLFGGGPRLATLATINLSEISEFALVICSLGMSFDHVEKDTLTILIWTFAMLAIMSANILPLNYQLYSTMCSVAQKVRGGKAVTNGADHHEDDNHEERDIVFLGFHKIAATLVYQLWKAHSPILHRMHVIDFNEKVIAQVKPKGLTASYGDISSPDVLEHCLHGEAKVVLLTIPNHLLRGTNNLQILSVAKKVWPHCKVIAIADSPLEADKLHDFGVDWVIESSQICADGYSDALKCLTGTFFAHHTDDHHEHHRHTDYSRHTGDSSSPRSAKKHANVDPARLKGQPVVGQKRSKSSQIEV